ncbi:MAG TPA: hypothetical protein VIS31_00195 [Woeseiaceae bacterium]
MNVVLATALPAVTSTRQGEVDQSESSSTEWLAALGEVSIINGGTVASSVSSQTLTSAPTACDVEKDKVAEWAPTALTVSPVITVSVGAFASPPGPPELPPHPQSNTHKHTGPFLLKVRGTFLNHRVGSR